jgi:hypothetical protein
MVLTRATKLREPSPADLPAIMRIQGVDSAQRDASVFGSKS